MLSPCQSSCLSPPFSKDTFRWYKKNCQVTPLTREPQWESIWLLIQAGSLQPAVTGGELLARSDLSPRWLGLTPITRLGFLHTHLRPQGEYNNRDVLTCPNLSTGITSFSFSFYFWLCQLSRDQLVVYCQGSSVVEYVVTRPDLLLGEKGRRSWQISLMTKPKSHNWPEMKHLEDYCNK